MKILLIFFTITLLSLLSFAQQFQLETTIDRSIRAVLDIDGDGICEYVADTNKVYDGFTHALKYTLPIGYYTLWGDNIEANNPYSVFPHIDFNSDGKRDLILEFYDSFPSINDKLIVFDIVNNIILFEFNPPEEYVEFIDLVDIDGDNELELIINADNGGPNPIHKAYIYSTGITTSVLGDNNIQLPKQYKLEQNFPNPFNPTTTIRYSLSGPEIISIKIYDVSGQLVKEIIKEHTQSGEFEISWDGTNDFNLKVSSGVYFYQLSAGNYNEAKKMLLLK